MLCPVRGRAHGPAHRSPGPLLRRHLPAASPPSASRRLNGFASRSLRPGLNQTARPNLDPAALYEGLSIQYPLKRGRDQPGSFRLPSRRPQLTGTPSVQLPWRLFSPSCLLSLLSRRSRQIERNIPDPDMSNTRASMMTSLSVFPFTTPTFSENSRRRLGCNYSESPPGGSLRRHCTVDRRGSRSPPRWLLPQGL